jgi:hypothetical protein
MVIIRLTDYLIGVKNAMLPVILTVLAMRSQILRIGATNPLNKLRGASVDTKSIIVMTTSE